MKWLDIVDKLLEDPMIQSCGCDGLCDAYYSLNGLYHMAELFVNLTDEFVCEVINKAIDGRNRYCWMNGAEKLPKVAVKDGDFFWNV